jgi:hypothetical protein
MTAKIIKRFTNQKYLFAKRKCSMKKFLNALFALAAIAAIASCQSEERSATGIPPGAIVEAQFQPVIPSAASLSSGEGGVGSVDANSYSLRYIIEVWSDEGTERVGERQIKIAGSYAEPVSFTVHLPAGYYKLVFWADFVAKNSQADLTYNTEKAGGLTDIEWKATAYAISSDLRDAYYAVREVDLTSDNVSGTVTLTRPFGKLRILAKAADLDGGAAPAKAKLTYTHADGAPSFPKSFNALTGKPNAATIAATGSFESAPKLEGSVTIDGKEYANVYSLAFDYFLVPADLTAVSFDVDIFDSGNTLIGQKSIPGVPVGANKLTTVTTFTTNVRYRGIGMDVEETTLNIPTVKANISRLGEWGVNHVRWPFELWEDLSNQTPEEYLSWIEHRCDELEAVLPELKKAGITVCITIIHPPRGRNDQARMRMFFQDDADLQGAFIEGWRRIATRFKNSDVIVYYDILNEPDDSNLKISLKIKSWRYLFIETVNAIKPIDDTKTFVFEPRWDDFSNLTPFSLDDANIVYSCHVYHTGTLTLQGVGNDWVPVSYPGTIDGEYWDKARIRTQLIEEINFVKTHKVEMYVGEFGCARWAPNKSAYKWFSDCLEIFEEEGWHYAFFKDYSKASENTGANTWSLQYDETFGTTEPLAEPTDRLKLLQSYWAKSKKYQLLSSDK